MNRTQWIDSCRFFAIFVIMCTHFLSEFLPEALSLWEVGISSWLLYGLTGKFSVAFFFVFLGYFASRGAGEFRLGSFLRYGLRRYVQFAFYIFLCLVFYILGCYACTWLFHAPGEVARRVIYDGFKYNLIYLLRDSLLFEDNYNATLWCMQQLFLASLICRAFACLPERLGTLPRLMAALALMLILMLLDAEFCVWICAALLGYVLRLVLERNERPSPLFLGLMAALALLFIKLRMEEGVLQYSLQSVAALLLIYIQFNIPAVQRLLSARPFPWLGGISMGLFVVHTPINALLASSFCHIFPGSGALIVCFILSLGLSILCAWLLHRLYDVLTKRFSRKAVSV